MEVLTLLAEPTSLNQKHFEQWTIERGINPAILNANWQTIEPEDVYDYLCYSPHLERLNGGRLAAKWMRRYSFDCGGVWIAGLDPLNNWQRMEWGQFRPDKPKVNQDGKPIKYEAPAKVPTRAFFPCSGNPDFWPEVMRKNAPIVLTEGAGKAGAIMTAGFPAVSLPGIYSGYRNPIDGNKHLIPDLEAIATPGRQITILFDQDVKESTKAKVKNATYQLAKLFKANGCKVSVAFLPEGGPKGADDYLVTYGAEALRQIINNATPIEKLKPQLPVRLNPLTRKPDLVVNERYFPATLPRPNNRIIALKAPMGSGKTQLIKWWLRDANQDGERIIGLVHRNTLGAKLGEELGLPHGFLELKMSEQADLLGMVLCVDSAHPQSLIGLVAKDWYGATVVIDEVVSVLKHILTGGTAIKDARTAVMQTVTEILRHAKQIIVADADLDDWALNLIMSLAGTEDVYLIENQHRGPSWDVYCFGGKEQWLSEIENHIEQGGKPFITTHSQQVVYKYAVQNLKAYLLKKFPYLRILAIDSNTHRQLEADSFDALQNFDAIAPNYDVVIVSPVLESGFSIDIKGHFSAVFSLIGGQLAENAARQILGRVRDPIPRYICVPEYGKVQIGNGASSPNEFSAIYQKQSRATKEQQRLLMGDLALAGIEAGDSNLFLNAWIELACETNYNRKVYGQTILANLAAAGHHLIEVEPVGKAEIQSTREELKAVRDDSLDRYCHEIITAPDFDDEDEAAKIDFKHAQTKEEQKKLKKFKLKEKYQIEPSAELVAEDMRGLFPKLELLYYLTIGNKHLAQREKERGQSDFDPDRISKSLALKIPVLQFLGISRLLDPSQTFSKSHPVVKDICQKVADHAEETKAILGHHFPPDSKPMNVIRALLGLIGIKLQYQKLIGGRGRQERCYRYEPNALHAQIMEAWLNNPYNPPEKM